MWLMLLCAELLLRRLRSGDQATDENGIRNPQSLIPGTLENMGLTLVLPAGSEQALHPHLLSMVPRNSRCSVCLLEELICSFPAVLVFIFKAK